MSDKNRKKRLGNTLQKAYVIESKQLYLPSSGLEGEDLEVILKEKFQQMEILKISDNKISLLGARILCKGQWPHLRRMQLKSCLIGPKAIRELIKGDWKLLEHLRLGFNSLGNEGIQYLSRADWKFLSELWLQGNKIGVQGIKFLSNNNWKQLKFLSLWDNNFEAECAKHVVSMSNSLKTLDITYCRVSPQQCETIRGIIKAKFADIDIRN